MANNPEKSKKSANGQNFDSDEIPLTEFACFIDIEESTLSKI